MSELSEALAKGKTLDFAGQTWHVLPLDFNDICDIEDEIGSVELLDVSKLKHQRLLVWLALRKADPTLGNDDRQHCRYRLTEMEVGQMVSFTELQKPETVTFLLDVLRLSGILPEQQATEEETKKKTVSRSRSKSAE
ncbi:hypothetical protein CCAX7_000360 [Capsulimonas corticalis]|uniref:Uncharacterized protein n=1 Tax=Capsulimonas corticalis TaxID=2219043 RepID=A0A402CRL7_9BACT|nr:hypothetical protein [Capsulimonas corticalis]BDI27985.1 hypothetical protein CCAX7_000360 [Capsulimonas corticalis]